MKRILQVIAFILIIFITPSGLVKAQDSITIDYFYGFNGNVLPERGFPLQLTITNSGKDFSGDLVIKVPSSYSVVTSIKVDVDILANSEAVYTVYLPGLSTQMNNAKPIVTLYEGNYEQKKEIAFNGAKVLTPSSYAANSNVIGTLTSNAERTNFLNQLKGINYQVVLNKDIFPKDSLGLEMFKMIFVDDIGLDTLSDEQLQSLNEWISNGGVLVSSTLPNEQANFLPLTSKNSITLTNGFEFNDEPFTQSIRAFEVELDQNANVITNNEGLIVAKKDVGNGAIVQYNYVLGDNPLISWDRYPDWLSTSLSKAGVSYSNTSFNTNVFANSVNTLNHVTENFKATSISLGMMVIILLVYLLIVTIIIYLILKRKQKLEFAWVVIPVIAIVSSIVIFVIGAKDRFFESQLNQVAIYTNHNGYLNGAVAANLLTNKGGDVKLSIDQQAPIYSMMNNASYADGQKHIGIVEIGNKQSTISYENVNYWSTVPAAAQVKVENAGSLLTDLVIKNGRLQGTITNDYPFDLKKLAVWSGQDYYELPFIAANETINVDITLVTSLLTRPQYLDLYYNYGDNIDEMKLSATNNYIQNVMSMINSSFFSKPAILAQTDEMLHSFSLTNGNYSTDHLTLLYQPIDVMLVEEGEIFIQSSTLTHEASIISGKIDNGDFNGGWYYVQPGEYEFTYSFPTELNDQKLRLVDLEATMFNDDKSIEFLLYNFSTEEYIPLTTTKLVALEEDSFILNNKMILKLIKTDNTISGDVNLPQMRMKVEVSK